MQLKETAMKVENIFANSALDHAVQALLDQMAQEGAESDKWAILVKIQRSCEDGESTVNIEVIHLIDKLNLEIITFATNYRTGELPGALLVVKMDIFKRSRGTVSSPPILKATDRPPLELVDPQLNPLASGTWRFPSG